jgi:hypothetical protein
MSNEPLRNGAPGRSRVDELLDRAFADDWTLRESFLRAEAASQSQVLAEALRSGRPDALRRLSMSIAEFIRTRVRS